MCKHPAPDLSRPRSRSKKALTASRLKSLATRSGRAERLQAVSGVGPASQPRRLYISNGPLVNQRDPQKISWVDCVVVNVVVKVHYSTGVKDDPKSQKLTKSLDTEHGNPIPPPQKAHLNIRNVAKGELRAAQGPAMDQMYFYKTLTSYGDLGAAPRSQGIRTDCAIMIRYKPKSRASTNTNWRSPVSGYISAQLGRAATSSRCKATQVARDLCSYREVRHRAS